MHRKSTECQPSLGGNTPESGTENGGITALVLADKSESSSGWEEHSCVSQVVFLSTECFLQKSPSEERQCQPVCRASLIPLLNREARELCKQEHTPGCVCSSVSMWGVCNWQTHTLEHVPAPIKWPFILVLLRNVNTLC